MIAGTYSLSAQIQRERKAYYDILERTQKRSMDVTEWLAWFLDTLHRAVDQAQHTLDAVLISGFIRLIMVKHQAIDLRKMLDVASAQQCIMSHGGSSNQSIAHLHAMA